MPFNGNSTNTNCWTLAQARAEIRQEILDPTGQWWTDTEINQYINDWQTTLQNQYEFVWNTATVSSAQSTLTLTAVATDMMRLDAIYNVPGTGSWGTDTNIYRMAGRMIYDLDAINQNWRQVTTNTGLLPNISYQNDIYSVSFWPPPPGTMTWTFEYPALLTMTADANTIQIPCWTRYSLVQYGAYRCYARFGPNQDLAKAQRRYKRWNNQYRRIKKVYDAYLPQKAEMLRPGRKYAAQILNPRQPGQILPSGGI